MKPTPGTDPLPSVSRAELRIQSETHDSVEDARTALALYRCYQRLQAQGGQALNDAIQQMYEAGRQAGWKVPGAESD